jgi:hypothetical protein
VIKECDGWERRRSILVSEGNNPKGWSKLESELQIAIRFFQPFLFALGNDVDAMKKKMSFTKVLQSTLQPTEDLFWSSIETIARVPKWLSRGNVKKMKHNKIFALVCSCSRALAKVLGKEKMKESYWKLQRCKAMLLNFWRFYHRCKLSLR